MEGGKSLTMVLPQGSNRPLSQFVEPPSPTDLPHPFSLDTSNVQRETSHRDTVYFTPRVGELSPSLTQEDPATTEEAPSRFDSLEGATGLGLEDTSVASHLVETSPTTLRGSSPAIFSPDSLPVVSVTSTQEVEKVQTEDERKTAAAKEEKLAEKRRRTIKELIDTESTYAVDMKVVRDIYLARAKGARELTLLLAVAKARADRNFCSDMTQIADYVMSTGLGLDGGRSLSPASPSSATFPKGSTTAKSSRRSLSGSISSSSANQANLMPGQPLMSTKDIHVIFANLEEIASLAESFAGMLEDATGEDELDSQDRIGEAFLEMVSS
jgi:hypothetical protein